VTVDGPLGDFAVTAATSGGRAVVAVRGSIDHVSAPHLGRSLATVIDEGHRDVVVDLTEVEFLDSSGLTVLEDAVHRLERSGGVLALRSPSSIVRRLLGIVGLDQVIRVESPRGPSTSDDPDRTGSVDRATPGSALAEPDALIEHLRRTVVTLADVSAVDDALRLVVALARACVGGADGVSISLLRHGRLVTVAASDQTISAMDAEQYATGEGPCVSASVEGQGFHAASLADEKRWPAFVPRARELGIKAILSNPLLAADGPIGALNIYSRAERAFATPDRRLASVIAAEASTVLSLGRVDASDVDVDDRLSAALDARKVIAQAQGVMMERHHIDQEAAFGQLLAFSRESHLPLLDRAGDIVATTQRPRRLTASDPDEAA
jgi:anti-anti-sigma factor